jgi:hypothetical protein
MLPEGAVHLPCTTLCFLCAAYADFKCPDKGIAKIARKLGFDYAEAVVCLTVATLVLFSDE